MSLTAGLGGADRNACVSLCTDAAVLGVCEQERITRVRSDGFNSTGLPDQALDELLTRAGRRRDEVSVYALAEHAPVPPAINPPEINIVRLDHHFAHACSAFLPSSFESSTIVVCDTESPQVSVWRGAGSTITAVACDWQGPGFAAVYSGCAEALGFTGAGREQRMEAMARLAPNHRDDRAARLLSLDGNQLRLAPNWKARIEEWGAGGEWQGRAIVAAALQTRLGDLVNEFLASVSAPSTGTRNLCVGGGMYFNSYLNSRVKSSGAFDAVFVPVNPGNAGLAVGASLHVSGAARQPVTPFLGPSYSQEEIKSTLDNCKLTYQWVSEADTLAIAVESLKDGRLVAWFDGPMEWGPRALGARSILANPFAPYALDNLNRFLKQRASWRGYALSGLEAAVREHFDGPTSSPYMECDFVPKNPARFREILPSPGAGVRVHTVGSTAPPRFRSALRAFGEASGIPIVVNTSFNGFSEPIVCSPRDAVRVFFGTGIDVLIAGQFVVSK
jgi:carbamoyltransferase